jgi:phenylacetate-CoA ligase
MRDSIFLDGRARAESQQWSRDRLEQYQWQRLNTLLKTVHRDNAFYRQRYGDLPTQLRSLSELSQLPLISKSDWINDAPSGIALHHSYPRERYRRYHRTSGTRGRPMVILDTQEDWDWWVATWQYVLDACDIHPSDRVMMAFSFGPFIGFWSAHDACLQRQCMVIPTGGMPTAARIDLIRTAEPTVLFCTPSYAIHLGREAESRGMKLVDSSIRCVFVAGEPGGSVPTVRATIESLFGARVMDHAGATEIGPWGYGSRDGHSLRVIETEFVAEFLPTERRESLGDDANPCFELVLTSLGRFGAPVIRYRTGDLVRPRVDPPGGESNFVRLEGGIVGRADDMFVVRGVNVFPSSIDSLVREFPEVGEYRLTLNRVGALDELLLEVEDRWHDPKRIAERLLNHLQLRVDVVDVPEGSLPKPEGKSRRIVDRR